jgi:serine/threonine protein phosphatase PrpC
MSQEDIESVFLGEPISYSIDMSGISPINNIIDVSGARDVSLNYAVDISPGEPTTQMVVTHCVDITQGEIQLSKGQDFTASGEGIDDADGEHYRWALLCDGHGADTIINKIREIVTNIQEAPDNFMNKASPILALQETLNKVPIRIGSSGSTCISAKIFKNRCCIESSGDSFVFVLENGSVIWKNKLHKWENEEEQVRLRQMYGARIRADPFQTFKVLSPNTLCPINATYTMFPPYGTPLATTQAVGHNNMTGLAPDTFTFNMDSAKEYTIVAFSDGVGDMLMEEEMSMILEMTVPDILAFAEVRWRQEWCSAYRATPHIKSVPYKFTKPSEFDDLSCFKVVIKPM